MPTNMLSIATKNSNFPISIVHLNLYQNVLLSMVRYPTMDRNRQNWKNKSSSWISNNLVCSCSKVSNLFPMEVCSFCYRKIHHYLPYTVSCRTLAFNNRTGHWVRMNQAKIGFCRLEIPPSASIILFTSLYSSFSSTLCAQNYHWLNYYWYMFVFWIAFQFIYRIDNV